MILAEIVALSRGKRQFAKTNKNLADTLHVGLRTVSYTVRELVNRDLIESRIVGYSINGAKKRIIIPNYKKIEKL